MKCVGIGGWVDGAVIGLLLAASLFVHTVALSSNEDAPGDRSAVVVFAPWVAADSAMQRVAATGTRIAGLGALPFIVIAEPDVTDFAERVAQEGALFVFKANSFGACFNRGAAI